MKKKLSIIAAGALLLAGTLGAVKHFEAPSTKSKPVITGTVEKKDLEISVDASGQVEPIRTVEVKSRASGEVRTVEVDTGDVINQGTLLAEIDPREVQNALDQAKADRQAAAVKAQVTEANRKRMEQLRGSGVVTVQEYESAVDAASSANASLVRAETNLQLAQEKSGDVTIRAPISGTVIERTVEPGTIIASATGNVSGGTTMFKMADLSSMQVRVRVDETDVGQVKPGQPVTVTVQAYPSQKFEGQVLKIEPEAVVEQNVTLFPVLVRLANPDGLLKPGMNAEVSVKVTQRRDATVVPSSAVVTAKDAGAAAAVLGLDAKSVRATLQGKSKDPSAAVVFVKTADATTARLVTQGLSDWDSTEVEGVEPGEKVVLVSVAQVQAQQQQQNDKMKQRTGGSPLGGGMSGGSRGRGG
ncbi:MAG: efflux RND transporter periplasmic adaptor subunit [Myxococcaceae bacterium]